MIHATEIGSENILPVHPAKVTRGFLSLSRTLFRSRAVLRLARKRHSLALGLALATGAAVSAAYATVTVVEHQVEARTRVEPLAPAPAPPAAPPVELTKKRHPLLNFRATTFRGLASWYGDVWNGRTTASGETFDETKLTAAHKTLPLGTIVRVTDMENMKSVIVKINDRGTLAPDRVIDLSSAAAKELGIIEQGLAKVKLEIVKKAS